MATSASNGRPLDAKNADALAEYHAREAGPLMFLRELTVNGLQAIAQRGPGAAGDVIWEPDWPLARSARPRRKLCCVDHGVGMAADELVDLIGSLASSGDTSDPIARFGIGSKSSVRLPSPAGIVYSTWKDGRGSRAIFGPGVFNAATGTDGWGLQAHGPSGELVTALEDRDRPPALADGRDGTMVTVLGASAGAPSMQAPKGVGAKRWIVKTLNERFFNLPPGARVLVAERFSFTENRRGTMTPIDGQRAYLERRAESAGQVALEHATAHWWLLDDDTGGRRKDAARWATSGHVAALHRDELHCFKASGPSGYKELQASFGIRLGAERVVIYVEPTGPRVAPSGARTTLTVDGRVADDLWTVWGEQFQQGMPAELAALQAAGAAGGGEYRLADVEAKLAEHAGLFVLSRHRAPRPPAARRRDDHDREAVRVDELDPPAAPSASEVADVRLRAPRPSEMVTAAVAVEPVEPVKGVERRPAEATFALPAVRFVSTRDGSRAPGELEDRVARYDPQRDELTVNVDDRLVGDLERFWREQYQGRVDASQEVLATVRAGLVRTLAQVVRGVQDRAASGPWTDDDIATALSPEALTAAAHERLLQHQALRRALAHRLR